MGQYQFRARLPQKGRSVEYVVEASSEEEALRKGAHRACQEHGVDRVELPLVSFLGHGPPTHASPHALEIRRRDLANCEESGVDTLFLALGMATWPPDDEGRPAEAAIVLLPVRIDPRGREGRSMSLQRAGDPQVNLALLHVLENT